MLLIREISLKQIRDDCVVKLMLYIKWSTICHVSNWFQYDALTDMSKCHLHVYICDLFDNTVL